MRKFTFIKSLMLVMLMMVGVGAWATDVTYTVASASSVETSGTAPAGSSATFVNTYTSMATQLTSANTMTLTLKGYAGKKITGITLSMKSNSSKGAGYLSVTAGSKTLASIGSSGSGVNFSNASWNGSYTTSYTDVTPTMDNNSYSIGNGENVVIVIGATTNSLYCQSFKVSYADANAPSLNSISVKTAPTKVTYMEGECFNPAGLVITKNLSNSTTEDVTYGETTKNDFTFNPNLTTELTNQTQVAITYGGKTVNQSITITPFVPSAGTYNINLNKDTYSVSIGNNDTEQNVIKKGVTVVSGCESGAGAKTYYDAGHIRYYVDSYLKLTAPAGYGISSVVFSEPSSSSKWDATEDDHITVNTGTYTNSSKTWTGLSSQVNFAFIKQCRVASISVTYVPVATITVNPACTEDELYYATYSNTSAFIVPDDDFTVYEVMVDGNEIAFDDYKPGDIVPANTGVLICALADGNYEVELTNEAGESVLGDDNALRATGAGITAEQMATADPGKEYFRLTMHNGNQCGFWWGAENGAEFALGANKAYLVAEPAAGGAKGFTLGQDDETAISAIKAQNKAVRYNLAGQRVDAAYKGIVIVNGKKVVK